MVINYSKQIIELNFGIHHKEDGLEVINKIQNIGLEDPSMENDQQAVFVEGVIFYRSGLL